MLKQEKVHTSRFLNGLDVDEYDQIVEAVRNDSKLAKFRFRTRNRWQDGDINCTTITGYYGAGAEQGVGDRHFTVHAGEPPVLLGKDTAPNPVEYLLHSLAACLTSAIVYKAMSRGITIESIESVLEGDMDARRFLELSDAGRTGFQRITAQFRIKADASPEELGELAMFSPVYDVISHGTQVKLQIDKV